MPSTPDLLYIDVLLLSYRLGRVRHGEERAALLAAAQAAQDSIGFMQALENFGITHGSRLHHLVGQFLAAPSYYRNHYSTILGIPEEGTARESFLSNVKVLYLVEPVLTDKQQKYLDHLVQIKIALPSDGEQRLDPYQEYKCYPGIHKNNV